MEEFFEIGYDNIPENYNLEDYIRDDNPYSRYDKKYEIYSYIIEKAIEKNSDVIIEINSVGFYEIFARVKLLIKEREDNNVKTVTKKFIVKSVNKEIRNI